jgi:hypothetical protein
MATSSPWDLDLVQPPARPDLTSFNVDEQVTPEGQCSCPGNLGTAVASKLLIDGTESSGVFACNNLKLLPEGRIRGDASDKQNLFLPRVR